MAQGLDPQVIYALTMLEEDIDVLSYTIYKLTMGMDKVEKLISETDDLDMRLILAEDHEALTKDFCMISTQLKLRLEKHKEICIANNQPIEMDYEKLYRQLKDVPEQLPDYD